MKRSEKTLNAQKAGVTLIVTPVVKAGSDCR